MDYHYAVSFKCLKCEKTFPLKNDFYICPECGSNVEIIYDYNKIKEVLNKKNLKENKVFDIFRYKDIYPFSFSINKYNKLKIGGTELYKSDRLGDIIGYKNFYIKDDTKNPSGSFKDRASIIALIYAMESNKKVVVGASTGNAASSLAALSASLGMKNIIFIPKSAPIAKVAQLLIFGANIIMVDGNYDDAFELSLKATEEFKLYNRNTGYNPFTREGKKSVSFEIIEQLDFNIPDYIFVPMGDGNIISGVWKGFKDAYKIGLIDKLPVLIGVQSENSSAIVDAFNENRDIVKVTATTIADSISVDFPRDGYAALKSLKESNGIGIKISDKKILEAQSILAKYRGIFAEPAGATSFAGLIYSIEKNLIDKNKVSVILVTGNGLKDINSVIKNINMPAIFSPLESKWKDKINEII